MEGTENSATSDETVFTQRNPRISKLFNGLLEKKISSALDFACAASIYGRDVTLEELTTAQILVLVFLFGLVTEDIGLTAVVAEESLRSEQTASSYLSVWMRDDFTFSKKDIARALTFMRRIQDEGSVLVPQRLTDILAALRSKYDVRVRRNGIMRIPSYIYESIGMKPSVKKEARADDANKKIEKVFKEANQTRM